VSTDQGLFVRPLDQLEWHSLGSDTKGATDVFFSPDGRWLGFYSVGEGILEKIPVAGGPSVAIATLPDFAGATWGAKDMIIVGGAPGLARLSASGGAPQPITKPDSGFVHVWPEILPGGKAVAFTILSRQVGASGARLAVAALETGKVTLLDVTGTAPHYVAP